MKIPGDTFGRGCLWLSLAALYGLLAMRLYVAWREGLWLEWPLGDFVPDAVVRRIFALEQPGLRDAASWLLGRDVLYWVAAGCLILWLLTGSGEAGPANDDDALSR